MNKRYIDFVPAKGNRSKTPVKKTGGSSVVVVRMKKNGAGGGTDAKAEKISEEIKFGMIDGANSKDVEFGVIEDFRPKFVKSEVKKRPLGENNTKKILRVGATAKSGAIATGRASAKVGIVRAGVATKVGGVSGAKVAKAGGASGAKVAKVGAIGGAKVAKVGTIGGAKVAKSKIQKVNFINTNKVEKRPLSKSVYPKKIVAPSKEEVVHGPEKIIAKPEKDSKAGLIIAIILTIILGAAAGTVAFLLLPK
ncbi:hypothetical protein IKF23_03880 [Candidatus Saccharibacteria bacterium]|nr:hypothetical protein [Candidatus Saccharibacteria bacterium]